MYSQNIVLFQACVSVSHYGIRPFRVFLEALLHYASPNWLADMTLCLGVASPPLSIKGATQRHYDIQKPLLASHQKPWTLWRTTGHHASGEDFLSEEEEDFEDSPFLPPAHTAQLLAAAAQCGSARCVQTRCRETKHSVADRGSRDCKVSLRG